MSIKSETLVYLHCYPDGSPFYVGLGSRRRSRNMSDRSEFHKNVRAKILAQGGIVLIKIDRVCTLEEARNREIELILLYGRRDLGTGPLVNLNRGGNTVPTGDRKKVSKFMKGNTYRNGTKHRTSVRARISESVRRNWQDRSLADCRRNLISREKSET